MAQGPAPCPGGDAGADALAGPTAGLAEQQVPTAAVVAHGVLAVLTIVLVLLAALGLGG